MSSIATSWEPWLSKLGPLIADLSNTASPATASYHAATAAEAEWWQALIKTQSRAKYYSPHEEDQEDLDNGGSAECDDVRKVLYVLLGMLLTRLADPIVRYLTTEPRVNKACQI